MCVQVQGGGLSEFSGLLRSSASLPMRWNATSDEFMSAVSFRNHAVRACLPPGRPIDPCAVVPHRSVGMC
jgi:hypothetical protein